MDQEILRTYLPRWKSLVDCNLVTPFADSPTGIAPDAYLFYFASLSSTSLLTSSFLPAPVYKPDIRKTEVYAHSYAVNAASAFLSQALDFLAAYCSPEAVEEAYQLFDNGIFLDGTTREFVAWTDAELQNKIHFGREEMTQWNEMIETGYHCQNTQLLDVAFELLDAYLAEQISLDECVVQMTSRVQMAVEE